ncbi:MAG: threonine--tRNA ligase [Candidatus Aenigmarchaeota archaeon]|nr:threonine--tRNA ligase [Candidatus Aenigmarchaeota archaeon]
MKLLLIHCDSIEWEAKKKAIKEPEETEMKPERAEEALVIFTAVEKSDEGSREAVMKQAIKEILEVYNQVKAKNIVLYPYAHLSSNLSSPHFAKDMLLSMESEIKKQKIEVKHAPFGWYKSFKLHAKGHPLAELSKEISAEKADKEKETKRQPVLRKIHLDKEELKENDHRILGQKLDLFSFQEVSPGMAFVHPKGSILINQLLDFWRQEHEKRGYKEISTPLLANKGLWQVSGHWDHYKENMFFTTIEQAEYAIKPMNCPGAILVYKSSQRSYRDLPLRLAELGRVHRNELSGVLSGLFRLRAFTQDDAHIFTTEQQLEKEIEDVVSLVQHVYGAFNFDYHVELSTRPEKRMGSEGLWDKAEKALEEALKKKKLKCRINKGDAAFYGPKIDFHIKDSLGRTWQCATIQVDFQMPEKFGLSYIDADNSQKRPVIIHRVVYGAIERFLGILVEHYNGSFPLWLSPVQIIVIPLTDRNNSYAEAICSRLKGAGIRSELDEQSSTVEYRIRNAQLQKIPYTIVVGDKEEKGKTIAVRTRDGKVKFGVKADDFLEQLKEEIEKRKQ